VEAQVLQKDDLAVAGAVDGLLDLLADAVVGESHALAEELFELGNNRLEAVLLVGLSVRAAKVRHEDDSLGSVLGRILDCGESTGNALVVCDVLVGVEGHVEVDLGARQLGLASMCSWSVVKTYTDQDTLALEVDVADGKLVGERHGGGGSSTVVGEGSAQASGTCKTQARARNCVQRQGLESRTYFGWSVRSVVGELSWLFVC
jgi:hypothetical protein